MSDSKDPWSGCGHELEISGLGPDATLGDFTKYKESGKSDDLGDSAKYLAAFAPEHESSRVAVIFVDKDGNWCCYTVPDIEYLRWCYRAGGAPGIHRVIVTNDDLLDSKNLDARIH